MPNLKNLAWIVFISLILVSCQTLPEAAPQPTQPAIAGAWWQPEKGLTWRIQYQGDFSPDPQGLVQVYNLDLFVTSAELVAQLHEQGARVICYTSVGTLEDWTPDRDAFPAEVLGKPYEQWPGETWLDLRRLDLLMPLFNARLDLCRQKGFDGVDPDNLDAWTNDTGFKLTREDTLRFACALADAAHARGLAIGLKNSPDLVSDLADVFDFMVTEEAFEQGWSDLALPFLQANKPVFAIEYSRDLTVRDIACRAQNEQGFSVLFADVLLDGEALPCP